MDIIRAQELQNQGQSYRQIAKELGVSKSTVAKHLGALKDQAVTKSWLNPRFETVRGPGGGSADIWGVEGEPDFATLMSLNDDSVYICANWLSDEVAKTPLKLYAEGVRKSSPFTKLKRIEHLSPKLKALNVGSEILAHPAKELLEHPNSHQTTHGFLKIIDFHLSLTGNAFIHKRREFTEYQPFGTGRNPRINEMVGEGLPVELWTLKVQHCKLAADVMTGRIIGIWYSPGTEPIFYPIEDIMWLKLEDPADPTGLGRGPARAAYERILLGKYELAYLQSLYRNQARPDALALMPDSTPDQREAFEKQFYQRFSKGAMGGIFAVDPEGEVSEFKTLGWSPKDVLGTELYKWNKLQILNCFKLNPAVIDQESSNRAVAETAKKQAMEYAVVPRLHLIEEKLTHCLLQEDFDKKLIAAFEIPPMEDEDFRLDEDTKYLDRGVKTINEVRKELGLPPVSWGDSPYVVQKNKGKEAANGEKDATPV